MLLAHNMSTFYRQYTISSPKCLPSVSTYCVGQFLYILYIVYKCIKIGLYLQDIVLKLVGLSEANSNKFRALLDTKPSATPTAIVSPPAQDGQVVTELKQHPRYLSEEEIQEVIIRYQEGVSANKLAEIYGCHKCTIRSALRRNGITVSHSIADKKLLVEKMILLRNQGYAMKEIAKMVGINYHTVLRYFREHGALPNSGMEDKHQSST